MDSDTLRRGVELAGESSGWREWVRDDGLILPPLNAMQGNMVSNHRWNQWELDALAAELVRMVDGSYDKDNDSRIYVMITEDETEIYGRFRKGLSGSHDIVSVKGPDRTKNTITACVEFLTQQTPEDTPA